MINEAYLRAVLLGGMQPTSLFSRGKAFGLVTSFGEPSGILSLPELERLQQSTLGNDAAEVERAQEIWYRNWNRYYSGSQDKATSGRNFLDYIIGDALVSVSQGAQWNSLRTNILSRLENLYILRDDVTVRSFLEKNFFLAPILLEANNKIREYFTNVLAIALEVSIDPENGEYQELWARIQTQLAPVDALLVLTRFDNEWWLQASEASKNLLNIKLEYV